jgi:hypothetical protein
VVARPSALQGLSELLLAPCVYEMSWGGAGGRQCDNMSAMGVWMSNTGVDMARDMQRALKFMEEGTGGLRTDWGSRSDWYIAGSKKALLKHRRGACMCGGKRNGPRETMLDIIKQTRKVMTAKRRGGKQT